MTSFICEQFRVLLRDIQPKDRSQYLTTQIGAFAE